MKITIDVDCTPQEARAFLGLPPIEPMQEALVAQMQERLAKALDAMDPDVLMQAWLPGGIKGLGEMQQQFWNQMMAGMRDASAKKAKG